MYLRVFVALIILLAIVVGILPYVLNRDDLLRLITFHDFFEVILPILGVGALIKYLCVGCDCCTCCPTCKGQTHHNDKSNV